MLVPNFKMMYLRIKTATIIFFLLAFSSIYSPLKAGGNEIETDSLINSKLIKSIDNKEVRLGNALKMFKKVSSKSDGHIIAGLLDTFKLYGKSDSPLIDLISLRLMENDQIYKDRGPKEVERLRGYMLASLSEIGVNEKILSIVSAELSYGYHPYMASAAARTAGAIHNSRLVPLLIKYLDKSYKDDFIDLDNYESTWPLKNPTSVRLEAIKSLGKIGASNSEMALKALNEITHAKKEYFFSLDSNLFKEAIKAANLIKSHQYITPSLPVISGMDSSHSCCSNTEEATKGNAIWINSDKRTLQVKNISAKDQEGNDFSFRETVGKPFAITFFYTRCDNPNKCSSTIEHFAELQRTLKAKGLADQTELYGITLEPSYDVPIQVKAYGKDRGMDFENNSKFLTMNTDVHDKLIHDLGVLVSYGKGLVNNHGSQLYIFDKKGRVAKIYDNVVWEDDSVIEDFNDLLKEKD